MVSPSRVVAVLLALSAAPAAAELPASPFLTGLLGARGEFLDSVRAVPIGAPEKARTHDELRAEVKAHLRGSGVAEAWIDAAFADPRAAVIQEVADRFASTAPAEGLPYDRYRAIFLTPQRIEAGADFIAANRPLLGAVRAGRGVDAHLLAALVGVETFYGRNTGRYPVFGALYTISLRVPRRSAWAARELAELLRLAAPQGVDPHAVFGSYAGAFGYAQFMPSSFVAYAVDQDGDGRRRWDEWPDMLGSAANYLARHGYAGSSFTPSSPIGRSIYAYNHSENYVRVVLELRAALLARAP
ncbi:MAG: lytic murein transglycosylase [Elusimicrobiota bacterium]|nr:lytic murein transglycosylase [Elusimicrobiota bacterium]